MGIMTDRIKITVEDMEKIVSHMKKLGFTRFLVSEPPFHDNVPLVRTFCEWGVLCHNSSGKIKKNLRKELQSLRERHPEEIKIFEEMTHLDEIGVAPEGEEKFYIDPVHAGQKVHDELTIRAANQIIKNGWDA